MKYAVLIFLSFSFMVFSQVEELSFDYSTLKEQPDLFDRKKLTLSGVVSDFQTHTLKDNLIYYQFKLSKSSNIDQYLNVYYFINYQDKEFPHPEVQNNKILQVQGEFRRTYENFDAKNLGDLYINKSAFEKLRLQNSIQLRSQNFIREDSINNSNATIYEMGIDYIGNTKIPVINVTGYIDKINYKEEPSGDVYWELMLKDHKKKDDKGSSNVIVIARYYVFLRGKRYADINMDDFFFEDQKVKFKGRYLFKDKQEINPIVGAIEMNYLDDKDEYKDHFAKTFIPARESEVAMISNANNDTEINKKIKNGQTDNLLEDDENDEFQ